MHKKRFLLFVLIIMLFFTACNGTKFTRANKQLSSDDTVQFHFIDVGQGDSVLIQNGSTNILVDAGPEQSGYIVYKYLSDLGITHLDYFISTHPHEDHLGGAISILYGIDVDCVLFNGDSSSSYFYEKFIDLLLENDIKTELANMDCIYQIGNLRLKFISPATVFDDPNNNSLVFSVQFGDIKALFTGDIERDAEEDILARNVDISADILKVAHHGGKNSSSIGFLCNVNPCIAVIQSGEGNKYDHPHTETLDRFKKLNCSVLRCDKNKTIVLTTDGKTIRNSTGETYTPNDKNEKIKLTYIGNKNSKVLHVDTCPNLPKKNNKVEFESKEEAINSGYKLCRNCRP